MSEVVDEKNPEEVVSEVRPAPVPPPVGALRRGKPAPAPTPEKTTPAVVNPAPRFYRMTFANLLIWLCVGIGSYLAVSGPRALAIALISVGSLVLLLTYSKRPIPTTVRRSIRRLPVLRDPGAQRVGALLGFGETTCAKCEHFDLEAGQQVLKRHDFGMAAGWLDPSQMSKTRKGGWNEENGFDEDGQPKVDPRAQDRWDALGVCTKAKFGTFGTQSCKDWS